MERRPPHRVGSCSPDEDTTTIKVKGVFDMKKLIVGALATLMLAGTVTAAFAFTSQDVSDSPETTVQGLSTGAIHYEVPEEATQ